MTELLERLAALRVVPVVTLPDAAAAEPLARALVAGGLPVAEITFRSDAAAAGIAAIRSAFPEVLVGAGTVLDVETVDRAIAAGAHFVVAPGSSPAVIDRCREAGVPVVPGAVTPTEIEQGLARGLRLLKFFPAEAAGGIAFLKGIGAPLANLKFCPTGGIDMKNAAAYLALSNVVAIGGSWVAPKEAIEAGDFARITALAREAAGLRK